MNCKTSIAAAIVAVALGACAQSPTAIQPGLCQDPRRRAHSTPANGLGPVVN
jgi:hypothetical protein